MRYIAVGDIHGCLAKLQNLLLALNAHDLQPDDQFVFLGDYVDRGPDSMGVIDALIHLKDQRPNSIFLRGNHEQMMLEARQSFDPEWAKTVGIGRGNSSAFLWFANGGDSTIKSYPQTGASRWFDRIPVDHWSFVAETKLEHVVDHYHFVHAGLLPPGERNPDGNVDPRLWIREPFLSSRDSFEGRIVVFGHTPWRSGTPLRMENKLGLDTAAVFGGPLTAAILDEEKFGPVFVTG